MGGSKSMKGMGARRGMGGLFWGGNDRAIELWKTDSREEKLDRHLKLIVRFIRVAVIVYNLNSIES